MTRKSTPCSLASAAASRSEAQRLITGGHVVVDGEARAKRHRVTTGERVVVTPPPVDEAESGPPVPYEVVYEDEHLLVVDKPAGVVVLSLIHI